MSYTYSSYNIEFSDEGTESVQKDWSYFCSLVSSEIGLDGVNPPIYIINQDCIIHNCAKVAFVRSHLKDKNKVIMLTNVGFASNNLIIFDMSDDSTFTDGETVNETTKQVINGSTFISTDFGTYGESVKIFFLTGTAVLNLYDTTFKISPTHSSFRVSIQSTGDPSRVWGCLFEGCSLLETRNTDMTELVVLNTSNGGYINRLAEINDATFKLCLNPIYKDYGVGTITPENPVKFNNLVLDTCTRAFSDTTRDTAVIDGTWIDTPYLGWRNGGVNPTRNFTLTSKNLLADSTYQLSNVNGVIESLTGLEADFGYVKYGELNMTALEFYGNTTTEEELVDSPFILKCANSGYVRQDRVLTPVLETIDDLGRTVVTCGPIIESFVLVVDAFVTDSNYHPSTIVIDHTENIITATASHTSQELYNATAYNSANSNTGLLYPIHASFSQGVYSTSYDFISDGAVFNGSIQTTGNVGLYGITEDKIIDSANEITIENIPSAVTISNSTNGLLIESEGSYDVSGFTFIDNTADITIADNVGDVIIRTGGATLAINEGSGNTVTYDNTVDWAFKISPSGGTFAMQNITKWLEFKGVFTSHELGQLSNETPISGDYYAVDTNSDGSRDAHGYWNGSEWIEHDSAIIAEHVIVASDIGGTGTPSIFTVALEANTNYRWFYDGLNYTPKSDDFNTGTEGDIINIELVYNESFRGISLIVYQDIVENYLPLATLEPADSEGILTGYIPSLPDGDIERAIVFVEYMRLTPDSAYGALATGDPILLEVIDRKITAKDDTFRVYPLKSYPVDTVVNFGAYVSLDGYTIEFAPFDENHNRVNYSSTPYTIVNGASIVGELTQITDVVDSQLGDWNIESDQLIMNRVDGTELKRFNLFDKIGNATSVSVFSREGV